MQHLGTVPLNTERLILRPFEETDSAAAFCNWMSDERVTRFLRWPAHQNLAVSEKIIREWIESYQNPNYYQWAIVLKEIGEPIGSISVVEQNEKVDSVEIGYCIGCRWWHQGIMSEALAAVIAFFFEQVKIRRFEAHHDPNNPHSGGVMRHCGMQYEGTLRQADWSNQGLVDIAVYSLLAEEYFAKFPSAKP